MTRTKAIAFADDLILVIRGETVSKAENFSNLEMRKITAWLKKNKVVLMKKNLKLC
jgi:hypothetical protein